jgi:hypothetical protein
MAPTQGEGDLSDWLSPRAYIIRMSARETRTFYQMEHLKNLRRIAEYMASLSGGKTPE